MVEKRSKLLSFERSLCKILSDTKIITIFASYEKLGSHKIEMVADLRALLAGPLSSFERNAANLVCVFIGGI